jgi:hypothetical protein
MKNGTYHVSFQVDISNCETEEEAQRWLIKLIVDSIEQDDIEFPEVDFELIEEHEVEYHTEEDDGVEELDFEETA